MNALPVISINTHSTSPFTGVYNSPLADRITSVASKTFSALAILTTAAFVFSLVPIWVPAVTFGCAVISIAINSITQQNQSESLTKEEKDPSRNNGVASSPTADSKRTVTVQLTVDEQAQAFCPTSTTSARSAFPSETTDIAQAGTGVSTQPEGQPTNTDIASNPTHTVQLTVDEQAQAFCPSDTTSGGSAYPPETTTSDDSDNEDIFSHPDDYLGMSMYEEEMVRRTHKPIDVLSFANFKDFSEGLRKSHPLIGSDIYDFNWPHWKDAISSFLKTNTKEDRWDIIRFKDGSNLLHHLLLMLFYDKDTSKEAIFFLIDKGLARHGHKNGSGYTPPYQMILPLASYRHVWDNKYRVQAQLPLRNDFEPVIAKLLNDAKMNGEDIDVLCSFLPKEFEHLIPAKS